MAYEAGKPYTYGIKDGRYVGVPTTASFYEKDGNLILDVNFAVKDANGQFYTVEKNGHTYNWEIRKRHWITTKDGAFNTAIIDGLREWAKGWTCADLTSFYWFSNPDANGVPFGNLAQIGDVELNFVTKQNGAQDVYVNPLGGRGRKAFTPEGAVTDQSAIMAKWGAKAKAVFAATPRKVAQTAQNTPSQASATVAPTSAPSAAPARPSAPQSARPSGSAQFPQTTDGAFAYYCSLLPEPYKSEKHDGKWFDIYDSASQGKDPDQFGPADVARLFQAVDAAMAK